jgi:tetratricopeptide (TPR) repeat protein
MPSRSGKLVTLLVFLSLLLSRLNAPAAEDDQIDLLNSQLKSLLAEGQYQEAVPIAEKLVALCEQILGPDSTDTATALNNLAVVYSTLGYYTKAEQVQLRALKIYEKHFGTDHPATARIMANLAGTYQAMGRYDEADRLFTAALQIEEKTLKADDPSFASILNAFGSLCQEIGQYQRAKTLLSRALNIRLKILGADDPQTGSTLNNLGLVDQAFGDYAASESHFRQALEIFQKTNHPYTGRTLSNLGLLYKAQGDYSQAKAFLLQAVTFLEQKVGSAQPETAKSVDNLGTVFAELAEYPKAEVLFKKALQILLEKLGPDHPSVASVLNHLATLYLQKGDQAQAEKLLNGALKIDEEPANQGHPGAAVTLNNLGDLYEAEGEYSRAEPFLQRALEINQKTYGPAHPATAEALEKLASLYREMGNYQAAEPRFQQALESFQKTWGQNHPSTSRVLNDLGLLWMDTAEFAKAEDSFERSLVIDQTVFPNGHPNTAITFVNLGVFQTKLGSYPQAESYFKKALEIEARFFGDEHPQVAAVLNSMAALYKVQGDYATAEPLFRRALEIREKVLGTDHPDTAESFNNLGTLCERMKNYPEAERLLQTALLVFQKARGPSDPTIVPILNNLALLYKDLGNLTKSEDLYRRALEINANAFPGGHPLTLIVLDNLALLEFDRDNYSEAIAVSEQANQLLSGLLAKVLAFASEEQRLAFESTMHPYTLLGAVTGAEAQLAESVLHYKGIVLDSIIEDRSLADAEKTADDRNLLAKLNNDKRELGQLLLQTPAGMRTEANQRVEALEHEVAEIEGTLAQHGARIGSVRRALTVTVPQVQAVIPQDAALIEYLEYLQYIGKGQFELRYGAGVLQPEGNLSWVPLGPADEIDRAVRRYQNLVRHAAEEEEVSTNLDALYQKLWAPIEKILAAKTRHVIISPDGQLNFVSIATLLDPDKRFLAEKYRVQYVASGRDLTREVNLTKSTDVVVVANPDFRFRASNASEKGDNSASGPVLHPLASNKNREIADLVFNPLPGTEKEGDALIQEFKQWNWHVVSLLGENATKEALSAVESPYILHVATHGFFQPAEKPDPGNAEETMSIKPDVTRSKFFENPMHRSGLALAGAQSTVEAWKRGNTPLVENDGILTAEDVSALKLTGTWLATLSACDTGSGQAKSGEGVMGLRRGFIEAGVQNLLMTLWPINDETTVQIVTDFYKAAHQSGNAPDALAQVQRDWLVRLRQEQGLARAVNLAGPFIMSSQGKPE